MTKRGTPCKTQSISKYEDRPSEAEHSRQIAVRLVEFAIQALCYCQRIPQRDIDRQRQAEQVGQQWYEAAVRNQARMSHDSRIAAHPLCIRASIRCRQLPGDTRRDQATLTGHHHTGSDKTGRAPCRTVRASAINQSLRDCRNAAD
jgi:hypothetical protein